MSPRDHADQGFVAELFDRAPKRPVVAVLAWTLAIGGHAGAATLAARARLPTATVPAPVEVEFLAPKPVSSPEVPPPEPVTPTPPVPDPTPVSSKSPVAPTPSAPAPAAAGALVTAKADAIEPNKSDDLVDFASDPDSRVYGGGVVAVGGTRMVGQRAARTGGDIRASRYPRLKPKGSPSHQSPGTTDLSRRPRLTEADPCRGFFPPSAMNNSALAAVMVVVDLTGRVDTATVISEFPAGQGFGGAARTCLLTKRFVPALDRAGHRTRAAIHVNVRFRR